MKTDYAKAFRIIRAAFGLSQSELAARVDVSSSQLSLIEKGKRQPSLRVIGNLGSATGIPISLISLLASSADDVANQEINELANSLLRLLIGAADEKQRSLPLG